MRLVVSILFLLATATSAAAQYPFEKSPWKATATVGGNTYQVWVDEVATNAGAPHGISSWADMQLYCRHYCFGCAPQAWGESQFDRALSALDSKDLTYVPLDSVTFVPVNIAFIGGDLGIRHPRWRMSDRDSFVLILRDGRRLVSMGPVEVPEPSLSSRLRRPQSIATCARLQRCMGGVTIYSRGELRTLAEAQKNRYGDGPWANIALIPVPNSGRPFAPRDARVVYLYFGGVRIDLQTGNAVTQ